MREAVPRCAASGQTGIVFPESVVSASILEESHDIVGLATPAAPVETVWMVAIPCGLRVVDYQPTRKSRLAGERRQLGIKSCGCSVFSVGSRRSGVEERANDPEGETRDKMQQSRLLVRRTLTRTWFDRFKLAHRPDDAD